MLSPIKVAIFLWPLFLFVPSVISRSFVLSNTNEKILTKREVETFEKIDASKPDIYSFTVTSNVQYRYAITTVSNRVANKADKAKEISFQVTLPDSAFISKFLMVIKDKVYEAYVKEKDEAKKDYQEAVDRGDTAGLVALSARDSNLFTVSVNVEPSSKVTFNLTYEQLLTRTLGLYENLINVHPGQLVKQMLVEVNIIESSNITSLEVLDLKTSNEIDSNNTKQINAKIERPTSTSAKITWEPSTDQQQQISEEGVKGQFLIRYDVDRVSNPNQILVDEGYFVHFYAPTNLKTLPKHVLFVLDISGSMAGRKIEQLREALTQILRDIGEGDFFSLVLFSDSVQLWSLTGTIGEANPTWHYGEVKTTPPPEIEINQRFVIPATQDNIKNAIEFAKTLNETGGTNIIAALRKSLQIAQWGQRKYAISAKPLIIFLTDGQPNVEMSDPEEIIKAVKKLNVDKYPIFSLGFGQGADFDFLRKLSLSNSGFARNIYVASDATLQLNNFYREVASPLLSNVSFDYIPGQVTNGTLTKSVFNNLYNGSELVIAGKLSNETNSLGGNVTYVGIDGFFCGTLPPVTAIPKTTGHLEKLWAYLYIKELLDQDLISDEKNSTYKQKALKLSLEYAFVTPLTSLVVVKPNETQSGTVIRNQEPGAESGALLAPVGLRGPSGAGSLYYSPLAPAALPPVVKNIRPTLMSFEDTDMQLMSLSEDVSQPMYMMSRQTGGVAFANSFASVPMKSSFAHWQTQPTSLLSYYSLTVRKSSANFVAGSTKYVNQNVSFFTSQRPAADVLPTIEVDSVDLFSTTTATPISTSLNISDIEWLQNKTEVKYPTSNNTYSILSDDLPDTEFQSCIIPNSNNTLGHCRHLAHCVIREILKSFEDFVPYGEQCVIHARFVGICCPQSLNHKTETTVALQNSTTVPTTTVTTTSGAPITTA